jgi:hypothetical protein
MSDQDASRGTGLSLRRACLLGVGALALALGASTSLPAGAATDCEPRNGLDALANGGEPGHWWALATDAVDANGRPSCTSEGNPVVQGPNDPAPGFYVSRTTMTDPQVRDCKNQRRYVDSSVIPYVALPQAIAKYDFRNNQGNLAVVLNTRNAKQAMALFADVAPRYGRGEGSIKLAELLGYRSSPRNGGTDVRENVYLILPSRMGFPKDQAAVEVAVAPAFEAWGGATRLEACAAKLRTLPK